MQDFELFWKTLKLLGNCFKLFAKLWNICAKVHNWQNRSSVQSWVIQWRLPARLGGLTAHEIFFSKVQSFVANLSNSLEKFLNFSQNFESSCCPTSLTFSSQAKFAIKVSWQNIGGNERDQFFFTILQKEYIQYKYQVKREPYRNKLLRRVTVCSRRNFEIWTLNYGVTFRPTYRRLWMN